MKRARRGSICRFQLGFWLMFLAGIPAWAGGATHTDNTSIRAAGACEFEAGFAIAGSHQDRSLERSWTIGCGVGHATQLELEVSHDHDAGQREVGYALASETIVWRAGDADEAPALAMAVGLEWSRTMAGAWRHSESLLTLIYSWPVGVQWTGNVNAGLGRDHAQAHRFRNWGLVLEREGFAIGTVEVAPVLEVLGDSRDATRWSVGLRFDMVPDRLSLTLASERPVGRNAAPKISVSLTLAFP